MIDPPVGVPSNFYTSVFNDSKINNIARGSDGKVFTIDFEILGEKYIGLNGGATFKFNEAFSIFVNCSGQAEVDKYWNALIADGGQESRCGWLEDVKNNYKRVISLTNSRCVIYLQHAKTYIIRLILSQFLYLISEVRFLA